MLRYDPELGIVKLCRKCSPPEFWPADNEFFHKQAKSPDGLTYQCKACYDEFHRKNKGAFQLPIRSAWEVLLGCPVKGQPEEVPA